jgi:prepilin-type N-terminal cleavage/methylation domain-containing protein
MEVFRTRRPSDAAIAAPLQFRRALTLIELLIVIFILSILVTSAIPLLAPGGDSRKIREASRAVNAFLAGAQSRAADTGRPVGVAFQRLSADTGRGEDNGVCTQLYYVETPAIYTGLDQTGVARVSVNEVGRGGNRIKQIELQLLHYADAVPQGATSPLGPNADHLPPGLDADLVPASFLRPGDRIDVGGWSFLILPTVTDSIPADVPQPPLWPLARTPNPGNDPEINSNQGRYFATNLVQGRAEPFRLMVEVVGEPGREVGYGNQSRKVPVGVTATLFRPTHDSLGNALPAPELITPAIAGTPGRVNRLWSAPMKYRIARQPAPAATPPLQLAAGAAIDLSASGFLGTALPMLYRPSWSHRANNDTFVPWTEPEVIMFSPDGSVSEAYLSYFDPIVRDGVQRQQRTFLTSGLSLCVTTREKIPAPPTEGAKRSPEPVRSDEPIELVRDAAGLKDQQRRELYSKYSWLSLDTRWVVIGAQSGSLATVKNAYANPRFDADRNGVNDPTLPLASQLVAVRENLPRRTAQGGR